MSSPDKNQDLLFAPNGWLIDDQFEPIAFRSVVRAIDWATETGWESLRTPHVLMGLLAVNDRFMEKWCYGLGTTADSLLMQFVRIFRQPPDPNNVPIIRLNREFFSENTIRVLRAALWRAQGDNRQLISTTDLLIAFFRSEGMIIAECFSEVGYTPRRMVSLALSIEEHDLAPYSPQS